MDEARLAEDLVAAGAGDAAAFGRLAQWLEQDCWRLACTFTADEDLAGDMWQDALLSAWQGLPRFQGDLRGFRAWMMTIVANRCRNQLASERRRRPVEPVPGADVARGDEQPTEPLHLLVDPGAPLDQQLEDQAWDDLMRTVLAAVPEPYQTALRYHCLDFGYAEIAALLGTSTNTVGTRIHRGREAARRFLAGRLAAGAGGPGATGAGAGSLWMGVDDG